MKLFRSINKPIKHYKNKIRAWLLYNKTKELTSQFKEALKTQKNHMPVIVVSYNNGVYVKNIAEQLHKLNIIPIIIDNHSSSKKTIEILSKLESMQLAYIVRSPYNHGHMVGFLEPIYSLLPETFAYTDPDLQFNSDLPINFLSILENLTKEYPVFKVGFALPLKNHGPVKETIFHSCHYKPIYFEKHLSIEEFESRYWINKLEHSSLELYASPIDTTFAVYNKSNYIGKFHQAIRVAGNFSAIHLPWFKELELLTGNDKIEYNKNNISSNW